MNFEGKIYHSEKLVSNFVTNFAHKEESIYFLLFKEDISNVKVMQFDMTSKEDPTTHSSTQLTNHQDKISNTNERFNI